MSRDYKDEYEKFQKDKSSYRSKLNKYNRDKGTYGNGDGMDASHKNGKISGFVSSSKNKGKKEKSRLKGSKRKEYQKGGKFKGKSHSKGGININVEGGEYVIKKDSVNASTEPILEEINKTGKLSYKCGGKVPNHDARKRRK
jgi:hypothetical protein